MLTAKRIAMIKFIFFVNRFTMLLIAVLLSISAGAQLTIDAALKKKLEGKTKLKDIITEVDRHYSTKDVNHNSKPFKEYKKWKRWEWEMVRHLDANGDFVNINQANKKAIDYEESAMLQQSISMASPGGSWTPVGPNLMSWWAGTGTSTMGIGRVDRIAFQAGSSSIMYIGTPAGGLWKSTNAGLSWTPLNNYWPSLGVSGIVVDRTNPNVLYVLTGSGDDRQGNGFGYRRTSIGVLKSTDGGNNWFLTGALPGVGSNYFGFKLVQSPSQPNVLLAATDNGLYRTNNGGDSWTQAAPGLTYDVAFSPAEGNIVFCSGSSIFLRSTDGGNNFTTVSAFSPAIPLTFKRTRIAVTPSNNNRVLFLAGNPSGWNSTTTYTGLWRSDDQGVSFIQVNNSPNILSKLNEGVTGDQSFYDLALAIKNDDANAVVVGGLSIWRSSDGGNTFPNSSLYWGSPTPPLTYLHPDVHDLAYHPINNFIYACTDGGVYRSSDNGNSWVECFGNLQTTQYYHMAGFAGDVNILAGGTQDNGTNRRIEGTEFQYVAGGDGYDVVYDHSNSNILYVVANNAINRLHLSANVAVPITPPAAGTPDLVNLTNFFPSLAIHPTNSQTIYAGYNNEGVFRSDNQGTAWISLGGSAGNGFSSAGGLAVSAQKPDRIYAASSNTARRSDNKGTSWITISGGSGWPTALNLVITDIRTGNGNADEVWVTFGGYVDGFKVLYSSDAGGNWTNFSGALPNVPVNSIYYTLNGDAYIGTDIGVYFMDFEWTDWIPFRNGLPRVPVTEVLVNDAAGVIRAATFGRGLWQSDLHSDCVPDLNLGTGIFSGYHFYQASNTITSAGVSPPSIGNELSLRAGNKITFSPGFKVLYGAKMYASIGPCGEGVPALGTIKATKTKLERLKEMK